MEFETVISKEIQDLLEQHKSLHVIDKGEKVKCLRSGHEMPCQLSAIMQYINGKKYKKFSVPLRFDMEKYKDVIVPSNKPGHEHQLFCTLTCRHMNNLPHHIEQHISGHRFQRAYQRWQHCQETGEVFRPFAGKRRERKDSEATLKDAKLENEENAECGTEQDDLSDLYPVDDFDALGLSGDEDGEQEASSSDFKKRKTDDCVSYQVKRSSDQKKTKCVGKGKVKKVKHSDQ